MSVLSLFYSVSELYIEHVKKEVVLEAVPDLWED